MRDLYFPPGYNKTTAAMHELQIWLENTSTGHMTGDGQTSSELQKRLPEMEEKFEEIKSWWCSAAV